MHRSASEAHIKEARVFHMVDYGMHCELGPEEEWQSHEFISAVCGAPLRTEDHAVTWWWDSLHESRTTTGFACALQHWGRTCKECLAYYKPIKSLVGHQGPDFLGVRKGSVWVYEETYAMYRALHGLTNPTGEEQLLYENMMMEKAR